MYKYLGKGDWFQDIPARDLLDEEVALLDEETKQMLLSSGLYKEVNEKPAVAKKTDGKKEN